MYMTKITLPALLLSAVLAAPAQNLLQNGDFEDDVAHWRSSGDPASVKTEIHDGSKALVLFHYFDQGIAKSRVGVLLYPLRTGASA